MMTEGLDPRPLVLTPEQIKRRRMRSLAIAGGLGLLVVLFFTITIVKMAGGGHGG